MIRTFIRKLFAISRRLWVRVSLVSVLSLVSILAAKPLSPLIPDGFSQVIGAKAVNPLLNIVANSMLVVTTFSVTVMVSVYQTASAQWTPRAHRTLLDDSTTQTVLATFVGAYIYALTSLIVLDTPFFGENEVVVLFLMTLGVIAWVVLTILRWILHLQTLGSLIETTSRVEAETSAAFRGVMERPCLGGHILKKGGIPKSAHPICAETVGFVAQIYEDAIQEDASEADAKVYLPMAVGRFVHSDEPIAWCSSDDPELVAAIRHHINISTLRTIDQDPRFGLIVLREIGSRALSPGINDPGTAIDVLGRITRILESFGQEMKTPEKDPRNPNIYAPLIDPTDLLEDGFWALARDGAGQLEVQISVQKHLAALNRHCDPKLAKAARDLADSAKRRALQTLDFEEDKERLKAAIDDLAKIDAASAK